jgi:GNAT superfamily N-acetyltransferase
LLIVSHTIGELSSDPRLLDRYRDPSGYIRQFDAAWVSLLRENPAATVDDVAIILAVDDDVAVGHLGMYAGAASVRGKVYRTFWLSGFFLNPDYVHTGAGGLLLLRALAHWRCLALCGGPRADTVALYKRMGFQELGPLRRYVYFYRPEVIIKKVLRKCSAYVFLSPMVSVLLRTYYGAKRLGGSPENLSFRRVEAFDESLDALMARRDGKFFPRDSKTLNWVLKHRSHVSGFQLVRDDAMAGYVLVRQSREPASGPPHYVPAMTLGTLLDYYDAGDRLANRLAILDWCIPHFQSRKADVFEVQSKDPAMWKACVRRGMVKIGGNKVMFRPPAGVDITPLDAWRLTLAEGDVILTYSKVTG